MRRLFPRAGSIGPASRWGRFALVVGIWVAAGASLPPRGWSDGEAAPATTDRWSVGVFALAAQPVADADTLRLADGSKVRVHGIDAEEVFKDAAARREAEADFVAYARARRGDAKRPVKYGTPMGEAASAAVRSWLAGVTHVRLERDDIDAIDEDAFGRRLAHVFVLRPAGVELLAERLIREGWAPYFVKYGRSRRFHQRFDAAQREAQRARRGIWSAGPPFGYPDYAERSAWWSSRDAQVERWRAEPDTPQRIRLGTHHADVRLAASIGKEVVVFGAVERLLTDPQSPRKILFLSHRRGNGLPVVVFDPAVWAAFDLDPIFSSYITVSGTLTLYRDRPQIVVARPEQLRTR